MPHTPKPRLEGRRFLPLADRTEELVFHDPKAGCLNLHCAFIVEAGASQDVRRACIAHADETGHLYFRIHVDRTFTVRPIEPEAKPTDDQSGDV